MAILVSKEWQETCYVAIVARIMRYPEGMDFAKELYDNVLDSLALLKTQRETGKISETLEDFRMRLRKHELALAACVSYCESLEGDMNRDIVAMKEALERDGFSGDKTPDDTTGKRQGLHESMVDIVEKRGRLTKLKALCNDNLTKLGKADSIMKTSMKQADTSGLELLYLELKSLEAFHLTW